MSNFAKRARTVVCAVIVGALTFGLVLVGTTSAVADDIDARLAQAHRNAERLRRERSSLEAYLVLANENLHAALLELNEVQQRLPIAEIELEIALAALEEHQREANNLSQRLSDAEAEQEYVAQILVEGEGQVEQARSEVARLARATARGGTTTALGLVTGAQSAQDFLEHHAVSNSAARSQARFIANLQDIEASARNAESRLDAVRLQIEELHVAAQVALGVAEEAATYAAQRHAEVQHLVSRQATLVALFEAERDQAQADLDAHDAAAREIQDGIRQLYAERQERDRRIEERRRQQQGNSTNTTPAGQSFLGWPVANSRVTSHFGMRLHPILRVWRLHRGIDMHAPCGVPILAAQSGEVAQRAFNSGWGNFITIDHGRNSNNDNVMTLSAHLSRMDVRVGQWVERGQQIGLAGTTGMSTGCHLHFEVFVNGALVNPLTLLPGS